MSRWRWKLSSLALPQSGRAHITVQYSVGAVQAGPKLHKGKYALQRNISSIKTTQVHSVRDREQIIVAVNSLCKLFFHTLRGEGSGVNPHIEG